MRVICTTTPGSAVSEKFRAMLERQDLPEIVPYKWAAPEKPAATGNRHERRKQAAISRRERA